MISYRNKEYVSEQALCQAYQYGYRDFMQLKEQGLTLPEIMVALAPTNSRVVAYDGTVYSNLTDFCNSFSLDYYRFRSKFKATGSMEQAIEHAKKPSVARGNIVVDGKTYRSFVELCEKNNISYASFMNYIHTQSMTPEQAYNACKNARAKSIPVTYQGKTYPSILSLCRIKGWNYSLMSRLLRDNVSVDEAAEKCEEAKGQEVKTVKTFEYKGKTYRSLHALAKQKGIIYSALHTMISGGMDPTAAVDELIYRKEHKTRSEKVLRNTQPVVVRGTPYDTIKDALKDLRINTTSYYARKAAHPELSPEELMEQLLDPKKFKRRSRTPNQVFHIRGETYGSQQEVFRKYNLFPAAVTIMMRSEKLNFEQAVNLILDRRDKGEINADGTFLSPDAMIINNHRFENPEEVLKTYGLTEDKILAYMEKTGCKERDAIRALASELVPLPRDQRVYVIDGQHFVNKRSVYNYFGVTAYAVNQYMERYSVSFEEAVMAVHKKASEPAVSYKNDPVTIHGITYPTVDSALSSFGIPVSVMTERMQACKETEEQALEALAKAQDYQYKPSSNPLHSYVIEDKPYPNKQAVLTAYGLSRYEVCAYMKKHTVAFEEAVLALKKTKRTKQEPAE